MSDTAIAATASSKKPRFFVIAIPPITNYEQPVPQTESWRHPTALNRHGDAAFGRSGTMM
jgi:hypothetical protein